MGHTNTAWDIRTLESLSNITIAGVFLDAFFGTNKCLWEQGAEGQNIKAKATSAGKQQTYRTVCFP